MQTYRVFAGLAKRRRVSGAASTAPCEVDGMLVMYISESLVHLWRRDPQSSLRGGGSPDT